MKIRSQYESQLSDLVNETNDLKVKKQCIEENFNEIKLRNQHELTKLKEDYEEELRAKVEKV